MSGSFFWIVDGVLGGMARPGRSRAVDEDLAMLREAGVTALVSLTVVPVDAGAAARHGVTVAHIPIRDFHPPTRAQIDELVALVARTAARGEATVVHCAAGKGRTGTMLAACLVARGMTADDAIAAVRAARPGAIETAEQERAVRDYASA